MPKELDEKVAKIKASYIKQGKSPKEAESLAWATVNAQKKRRKSGKHRSRKKGK
jgi:hypothetical protein